MMSGSRPELSVVLCTYNPNPRNVHLVLDALRDQTLPRERWELVVVDNNSSPPLEAAALDRGRGLPLRVVRETWQGKVPAYRAGVLAALADLLVLVDDDNVLHPDYLELALDIARDNPGIGAFGGIARARIEGPPLPRWKERLLLFLGVRDFGVEVITSTENRWGRWEPIGAGMAVRRVVGRKFVEIVDSVPEAAQLDRIKRSLLSGGDSLLARASYPLGLACSYQPALRIDHIIARSRLRPGYLVPIMYGHGRSMVKLNRVLGLPNPRLSVRELLRRLPERLRADGWGGPFVWLFDFGYFMEARREQGAPSATA